MLVLNDSDIINSINSSELLTAVEDAFLLQESGDFLMPDRTHTEYKGNVLLMMPAFAGDYFGTKLVSVFPENFKRNLPSVYGSVVLNDGHTGEPLAFMNGAKITALRTGAVGALGIAYTTPKEIKKLGLFGAGVQGFHQVMFACAVRNISEVRILDPYCKNPDKFIKELQDYFPDLMIKMVSSAEKLIRESEAIITATTSIKPVVPDIPDLFNKKHFIGIGSYKPEMQEYPDSFFSFVDQVFIDTPHAKNESGDITSPLSKGLFNEDQVFTLGKLINNEIGLSSCSTTFFKSVGMALFDLLTAEKIYQNAVDRGIGQKVNF